MMSNMFGSDVNFTPVRDVYPTAAGGTLASAAGAQSADTNTVVTTPSGESGPGVAAGVSIKPPSRATRWYYVGIALLLVATVLVARKAGGPEDFANLRPTLYNFATITLTALVGIVGLKVIFTRFHVAGISDVVMAA